MCYFSETLLTAQANAGGKLQFIEIEYAKWRGINININNDINIHISKTWEKK